MLYLLLLQNELIGLSVSFYYGSKLRCCKKG